MLPIVALVRRFSEDFLNAHNADVPLELLIEDYRLMVAGTKLPGGAAGYHRAARNLFEQFPDLRFTMHEVITDGSRVATRFSVEGSSTRHSGNKAAWGGCGIYGFDGERFTECWVEEDHDRARRQLRSGGFEPLHQPPGPPDPFTARPTQPGDGVTDAAISWLVGGGGERLGSTVQVDALLVTGDRFAFHTSSPSVHVSGMATAQPDGSVRDISTFSDGGTPA